MKSFLAGILLLSVASTATAQDFKRDSTQVATIAGHILFKGQCYEDLRVLTKTIGHRLSGTPEAEKAVAWGRKTLLEAGADTVILQPVWVPKWVRGQEKLELELNGKGKFETVKALGLGNAVGTDGKTISAPVIMVRTLEEFNALTPAAVKGKIVFFNYPFRQEIVNAFEAYGDAFWLRGKAPSLAAAKGAQAIIIRSLSTGLEDVPHTGTLWYADSVKKIPAFAIGNTTAEKLDAALSKNPVSARVMSEAQMHDSVLSYNVIGELKGTEDGYIVVGGHLDSWDIGEGAQDDGAGCVQSIEVIRTFKALGIQPRYTIRAVLFMNEENGARGGRAYADSARTKNEKHILAMESDAGGFTPRGVGLVMSENKRKKVQSWKPYFLPLGVYEFDVEEGGVDISFLGKNGVPLAGLLPDPQRYFDMHHSEKDVFEIVDHRELKMGAATMAALVWLVDQYGL